MHAAFRNVMRKPMKTCTRGHHYRGSRCPICWPNAAKKTAKKKKA